MQPSCVSNANIEIIRWEIFLNLFQKQVLFGSAEISGKNSWLILFHTWFFIPFYPCNLHAKNCGGIEPHAKEQPVSVDSSDVCWALEVSMRCRVQLRGGQGGIYPAQMLGMTWSLAHIAAPLACSDRVGAKPPPDSVPTSSVSKRRITCFTLPELGEIVRICNA